MPSQRDNAKPWFLTGKKPTQAQFHQLLDMLFFKDEGINMDNVTNLVNTLSGKASKNEFDAHVGGELIAVGGNVVYNQQANYIIEKLVVIPLADCSVRIGTTDGGEEIQVALDIVAADPQTHAIVINAFTPADRTIYINGIPAGSKLIVVKRKLKVA